LKVTEKRPAVQKSLEEVRDRIRTILTDQKAQELADQRIADLEKKARDGEGLAAAAAELGYTVQETGLLAEGDPVADIDTSGSISRSLFSLEDQGLSTPVYTYSGVGLVQLQAVEPSRPATFEEAEGDVKEDLIQEEKKRMALEKAQDLKRELETRSFEQVSESNDLEFRSVEEHKREQYLGVIGENPEVDRLAFEGELGRVSDPLRYDNGYLLLRVLDRTEVTREDFEENRKEQRESLLEQKRNRIFASFYNKLRQEKDVRPNYNLFFQINSDVLSYYTR
jgi:peptidyl-prolyl cis-trans isomerase D